MVRHNLPPNNLEQSAHQTVSHPWFERLSRLGYAAKGIVYFVVGLLALQAAIGSGSQPTDTNGALEAIVAQPFGKFLLGIVAIGLIGYVLWRIAQAVLDPEHSGQQTSAKQVAQRIGYAFSAAAYTGLAATAVKLILGTGNGGDGNATQDWTARFLSQPFGQWLVGLAGLITIGVGISYLYEAYKAKFRQHLNLNAMTPKERTWAMRAGRFGIAARGVVFGIIGIFLIQAAIRSNPNEAKGLGNALAALAQQPFGPWLLGLVALGLIAYSIYSLVEARYRKLGNA
ncbi:DUF1206 domain-containing protein [Oscillatoria sp. FACHB-1407]|uniref:DUF1206 domain-containing protein n=1 Tax=Oscillatoria sp. FACHB-1407 TaxID=2692847 RepID=UPI0016826021|nr:DUF1206 domain-containing protein [Oscillatoria sp. FACHB-1407]MBD2463745.1 DUF1206 domain-containing protein [Oscillatoria sp. FACHB-1407]